MTVPPLALTLLLLAGAWVASAAFPGLAAGIPGATLIGALVAGVGAAIVGAGALHFRLARTTLDPRVPERASQLVTGGIYRLTRNPMYLGFVLAIAGWGVFLDNLAAVLPFAPAFAIYIDRVQIPREERALRERFGDEFAAYARRVGRWL